MKALSSALILTLFFFGAQTARATDRDLKAIFTTSGYGMLAGTGIGLIAWPISRSERAIFLGTSLGLYLGIAVGVYYIYHRDEPGNPLHMGMIGPEPQAQPRSAPRLVAFEVPVYRF